MSNDVRILSDTPLALIREIIEQVTPRGFWVHPSVIGSIALPQFSTPETIDQVYGDASCTTAFETKHIRFAKRVRLSCKNGSVYDIGALLLSAVPPAPTFAMCVTTDWKPLLLAQSDSAVHKDGTIQIYGAEPGITVFRPEVLTPQLGQKLLRGDALDAFALEALGDDGLWHSQPMTMSSANIREIKAE